MGFYSSLMRPSCTNILFLFSVFVLILGQTPTIAQGAIPSQTKWKSDIAVRDLDSLILDSAQISAGEPKDSVTDSSRVSNQNQSKIADSIPPLIQKTPLANISGFKGLILSADNGQPIEGVMVQIGRENQRLSAQTNSDGLFELENVPSGNWRLVLFRKGFETFEDSNFVVASDEVTTKEFMLERRTLKGQVIQARSERRSGSSQDLVSKRQKTAGVMEGVSAEQIAKSTDSDAGAVAKRLTGTSLIGGKYVYVRGLGERYTNMTLNGLPLPSPEKDKRVVPQDLFPAGALESFSIYKTFMPDLYSDFAGGSVALVTKSIPDKAFFKVSLTTGNHYDSPMDSSDYLENYSAISVMNGRGATPLGGGWGNGNRKLTYNGGNTYWGFDDGTRSLPNGFPGVIPKGFSAAQAEIAKQKGEPGYTPEERAAFSSALPNIYSIDTARVRPPIQFSISAGNVYPGFNQGKFGYLFHAGFKNKYDQFLTERQQVGLGLAYVKDTVFHPILKKEIITSKVLVDTVQTDTGKRLEKVRVLQDGTVSHTDQGTYDAQLNGMLNMRYENEDWAVWWKNFLINTGTDKALVTRSYSLGAGGISQDKVYEERYLLDFNRRSLINSQVGGEAYLGKSIIDSIAWAAGMSSITAETPDSRRYQYTQNVLSPDQPLNFANNDIWGTRVFENLKENAFAGRADAFLVIPPEISERDTFFLEDAIFSHLALPTFGSGLAFNAKSRDFDATRYSYDKDRNSFENMTVEEVRDPKLLEQDILTGYSDFATSPKDYDTYNATEIQAAAYLSGANSARLWGMPFGMDGGWRLEWYSLQLSAPYTGEQENYEDIAVKVTEWSQFPTVGAWFQPLESLKLRLQTAWTAVRPELREIAPYQYVDFVTSRTVQGNPDLRKTTVTHYDLRVDWFLPYLQSFSFSLFYKDFNNPVEPVIQAGKKETFQNASGAFVSGFEFEFQLEPRRLLESAGIQAPWLDGLRFSGNYAAMESEVKLVRDSLTEQENTSFNRPLVGQAPYLINGTVSHELEFRKWGVFNAILFNMAGERIRFLGAEGVPDFTETPFPSLESIHRFTWLSRNELNVKVKNWLMATKEIRARESNDEKTYQAIPKAKLDEVFGNVQRYHTVERYQESLRLELSYARQF